MNPQDLYASYNRSLHVFVMCFAALLGPLFLVFGLEPQNRKNLILGVLLVGYYCYQILKLFPSRYSLKQSDRVAFLWVPVCCLPFGLVFAVIAYGI